MSRLLDHMPMWLRTVLKVFAGMLLFALVASILFGIGALIVASEHSEDGRSSVLQNITSR